MVLQPEDCIDGQGEDGAGDGATSAQQGGVDDPTAGWWDPRLCWKGLITSWFSLLGVDTGSKFPSALLARNAPPHAACAGLLHGGEHRRRV